jgi:hypothetical protein
MASRLRELMVEFVSLVDRAATRDPSDPTQPQRFLLTKSEDLNMADKDLSVSDEALSNHLIKVRKAADAEPHRSDLRKASSDAQLEYLRTINPAAAAAWERSRA